MVKIALHCRKDVSRILKERERGRRENAGDREGWEVKRKREWGVKESRNA